MSAITFELHPIFHYKLDHISLRCIYKIRRAVSWLSEATFYLNSTSSVALKAAFGGLWHPWCFLLHDYKLGRQVTIAAQNAAGSERERELKTLSVLNLDWRLGPDTAEPWHHARRLNWRMPQIPALSLQKLWHESHGQKITRNVWGFCGRALWLLTVTGHKAPCSPHMTWSMSCCCREQDELHNTYPVKTAFKKLWDVVKEIWVIPTVGLWDKSNTFWKMSKIPILQNQI